MIEQVPGIRNPTVGDPVNVSGTLGTVDYILRYNGSGRFTSLISVNDSGECFDIVWDSESNIWNAITYEREHYPDLDGVNKRM